MASATFPARNIPTNRRTTLSSPAIDRDDFAGLKKDRYDLPMQTLHWLIALLIVAAWVLVQVIDGMPRGPERISLFNIHKSVGATVLFLVMVRLAWRLVSPPPALPGGMSPLMIVAAKGGHLLLYVLMLGIPVLGVLAVQAHGRPVEVWGLFSLPTVIGENKDFGELLGDIHGTLGNAIMVVAGLHAAVALFHQFVLKDGLLSRMVPWGSRD